MKFLTIGSFKDTFYTIPAAERQKVVLSQSEYNLEMKRKLGDKFLFYTVPGHNKLAMVVDVASLDELSEFFRQAPVVRAGHFNYESYPLIEMSLKALEARLAGVKATV